MGVMDGRPIRHGAMGLPEPHTGPGGPPDPAFDARPKELKKRLQFGSEFLKQARVEWQWHEVGSK